MRRLETWRRRRPRAGAHAEWSARDVCPPRKVSCDFVGRSNKPRKIICGAQYSPGFEPGRAQRRCYNFSFSMTVQSSIQSRLEHTRVPESYRKGLVAQWIRRGSTEPEIPGSIPGKIKLLFFIALARSNYFFLLPWQDQITFFYCPDKIKLRVVVLASSSRSFTPFRAVWRRQRARHCGRDSLGRLLLPSSCSSECPCVFIGKKTYMAASHTKNELN